MLLLRQFGRCFRVDVTRDANGRSRGFGFIEFETREGASLAAEYLDGAEIENRHLRAEIAQFPPDELIEMYIFVFLTSDIRPQLENEQQKIARTRKVGLARRKSTPRSRVRAMTTERARSKNALKIQERIKVSLLTRIPIIPILIRRRLTIIQTLIMIQVRILLIKWKLLQLHQDLMILKLKQIIQKWIMWI